MPIRAGHVLHVPLTDSIDLSSTRFERNSPVDARYLIALDLHREARRRELDQLALERVAAASRRSHSIRRRIGESLIRLGHAVAAEPSSKPVWSR